MFKDFLWLWALRSITVLKRELCCMFWFVMETNPESCHSLWNVVWTCTLWGTWQNVKLQALPGRVQTAVKRTPKSWGWLFASFPKAKPSKNFVVLEGQCFSLSYLAVQEKGQPTGLWWLWWSQLCSVVLPSENLSVGFIGDIGAQTSESEKSVTYLAPVQVWSPCILLSKGFPFSAQSNWDTYVALEMLQHRQLTLVCATNWCDNCCHTPGAFQKTCLTF